MEWRCLAGVMRHPVVLEAVDGSELWSAPMDIRTDKAEHLLSPGTEMVEPYAGTEIV